MKTRYFAVVSAVILTTVVWAGAADKVRWATVKRSYAPHFHPKGIGQPPDHPAPPDSPPVEVTNVVLENEHIRIEVAVQAAGRVMHATYKDGTELFNVLERMAGGQPWDGGGWRSSFPFQEHGMRYTDQPAGWRVIEGADGSVTLTMDMRFGRFLGEELGRYGRFTPLRLGRAITLRPGSALFEVASTVENPLPYRFGYRLWSTAQFPDRPDAEFWFPVSRVSDHGLRNLADWIWHQGRALRSNWNSHGSVFSINSTHPFTGIYYPSEDLNRLRIARPDDMPGGKLYAWGYPSVFFEVWTGSEHLFEQEGRLLPPFAARRHTERYYAVHGIGRVEYANEHFAVSTERSVAEDPPNVLVRLFPVQDVEAVEYEVLHPDGRILARADAPAKARHVKILKTPVEPGHVPLRVSAKSGGQLLLDVTLPLAVPRPDPDLERHLMTTIRPGREDRQRIAESQETRAWIGFRSPNLAGAALRAALDWTEAEPGNVAAQRQLGRVLYMIGRPHKAAAALQSALSIDGKDAHSRHLLGLVLLEQGDKQEALRQFLLAVPEAPEAHHMAAMVLLSSGDRTGAIEHLRKLVEAQPWVVRPRIVLAALLAARGPAGEARVLAEKLQNEDPSSPEIAYLMTLCHPQDATRAQTLAQMLTLNPEAPEAVAQLRAEIEQGSWVHPARPDVSNVEPVWPAFRGERPARRIPRSEAP
jgi:tetratricopeptide (TPR) repeat protein